MYSCWLGDLLSIFVELFYFFLKKDERSFGNQAEVGDGQLVHKGINSSKQSKELKEILTYYYLLAYALLLGLGLQKNEYLD